MSLPDDLPQEPVFLPLFVYGQLEDPAKPKQIACAGELRLRGTDAAARFGPGYKTLVWGQVEWVDAELLHETAQSELPEYKLARVLSVDGRVLYAFEDVEEGFEDEPLIPSGRYEQNKE